MLLFMTLFRYWGEKPTFGFRPLDHYTLMQKLDVVDTERAVKIAGARSYALKGDAARLELALMNFAMDRIARKGFKPVTVPAMAREFSLALPRILLSLFEVHQQPDGSVRIPAAVRPYMGGQEYIRPRQVPF